MSGDSSEKSSWLLLLLLLLVSKPAAPPVPAAAGVGETPLAESAAESIITTKVRPRSSGAQQRAKSPAPVIFRPRIEDWRPVGTFGMGLGLGLMFGVEGGGDMGQFFSNPFNGFGPAISGAAQLHFRVTNASDQRITTGGDLRLVTP